MKKDRFPALRFPLSILFIIGILLTQRVSAQNAVARDKDGWWLDWHYPVSPYHRLTNDDYLKKLDSIGLGYLGNLMRSRDKADKKFEDYDYPVLYKYEGLLLDAAGVQPKDDDNTIADKMRRFWKKYDNKIVAYKSGFSTPISILKVAFWDEPDFLHSALEWKLPLNEVEIDDWGRTLLDYVADRYYEVQSPELQESLKYWYDRLKRAGAKHRFELESEGSYPTAEMLQQQYLPTYIKMAKAGEYSACFYLDKIYSNGFYVKKDMDVANYWMDYACKTALEKNDADAMYYIANRYQIDRKNEIEADKWYQRAAAAGNTKAMFFAAQRLLDGSGGGDRVEKAIEYLLKTEAVGEDHAPAYLGKAYLMLGRKETAEKWFRYAARIRRIPPNFLKGNEKYDDFFQRMGMSRCGPDIKGKDGCQ